VSFAFLRIVNQIFTSPHDGLGSGNALPFSFSLSTDEKRADLRSRLPYPIMVTFDK